MTEAEYTAFPPYEQARSLANVTGHSNANGAVRWRAAPKGQGPSLLKRTALGCARGSAPLCYAMPSFFRTWSSIHA